jgi:hypothetical protein
MINPVTSAAAPVETAPSTAVRANAVKTAPPAPAKPEKTAASPVDTVTISNAAQALSQAAVKEALETPVQTAQEAGAGDVQAQRLMAKEAAEKAG